jgi:hypothetical protein
MTTLAQVGFCYGGGELSERVVEKNTTLNMLQYVNAPFIWINCSKHKRLSFTHTHTHTHTYDRWFWSVDVTTEGWTLCTEFTRKNQSLQEQSVKQGIYGLPSLWNPQEKGLICLLKISKQTFNSCSTPLRIAYRNTAVKCRRGELILRLRTPSPPNEH